MQSLIKGAQSYYTYSYFTNQHNDLTVQETAGIDSWCVDISRLKGEYVDLKQDMWGRICFIKDEGKAEYSFIYYLLSVSNGEYYIQNLTVSDLTSILLSEKYKETLEKSLNAEKVLVVSDKTAYMMDFSCFKEFGIMAQIRMKKAAVGQLYYYKANEDDGHNLCGDR